MKYSALFIGLTTIDIQYFVDKFPKSNVKVKTQTPELLVGGPATNAAVAFGMLNNGVHLATAIGKNSFSEFIINDFNKTRITSYDILGGQNFNPVLASVITAENGERNIFTHHPDTIDPALSAAELIEKVQPEIILIDGFYPEFSIECAKIAKQKNIPVVLDCGSWKLQYEILLNYADIAICSDDFYPPNCKTSQQVFGYLHDKKIDKMTITRGDKSILFFDKTEGEIPIQKLQVVDSLGAGDFFHGAFCYFFLNLCNFKTALQKAAEIASLSCCYKGTREWLIISEHVE